MQFRTKLTMAIALLCALSFVAGICVNTGFAQPAAKSQKVYGKLTIKKGTELGGMAVVAQGVMTPFQFIAFKDQTLYITQILEPVEGKHSGGYLLDASGFSHDCPAHGEETIDGVIGVPHDQIKAEPDNFMVEIF